MDKRTKENIYQTIWGILKVVIGIAVILPILYSAGMAFMTPPEITDPHTGILPKSFTYLDNFTEVFHMTIMGRYLFNSLIIAFLGTLGRIITSTMAAFAFSFYDFKGKRFFFMLVMGSMMVPGDVLIFSNYLTVSRLGLMNSYLGIVIIYLVFANYIFMLRQHMLSLPVSLFEAAKVDGCSNFRYFWQMVIPLSKSIIVAVFLSSFVGLWNIYLWPLIITNDDSMRTVQVGVSMLSGAEQVSWGPIMAASLVALFPTVIIFSIFQKHIVRGMTAGAVKG